MLLVLLAVLYSDPADFVRHLYSTKVGEAPDRVYGVYSRKALTETFEGPIVDLIWRDLVDAMGEVGRMDGHYLYDAQDDEITNLQVTTLENSGERARVLATFEFDKPRSAEFHLRQTSDGWRISNIVYAGGASYMGYLQADFPLPKIEDEEAAMRLCMMYAGYKVAVPEHYDPESEGMELAELFANGTGVRQDFGAAIHFLCETSMPTDAEKWRMLTHVLQMERGATAKPLDLCEHSGTRHAVIVCAGRRAEREALELRARFAAVRARSGKALDALRKAADDFIAADVHWEKEPMRGRAIFEHVEPHLELEREQAFVELLERYASERAPAASNADLKRADAELNAAYRKRLASEPTESDNLRAAQREWAPYRDAWIAWYQERWRGAASRDVLRREIATAMSKARAAELSGKR